MRPSKFIEEILRNEFADFITRSKLRHINRAMANLSIVSGWDDIDVNGVAWAIYTAVACQRTQYPEIKEWILSIKGNQVKAINILTRFLTKDKVPKTLIFSSDGKIVSIKSALTKPDKVTILPKQTIEKIIHAIREYNQFAL